MILYSIQRLLSAIPTLALLALITFSVLRLAPGGPFDGERAFPPEVMANINARYELDQPFLVQFAHWARDAVRGDLRESFQYIGRSVNELIGESLPVSIELGLWSMLWAVFLGVIIGAVSALKRGTWIDTGSMWIALSGVSLPSYLVASLLVLLFSTRLGWLPPALWEDPWSRVLPAITMGLRPMALLARLTRSSIIDSLKQDYVRTARAKGLSTQVVLFKHALRNALVPALGLLGPIVASLVTGSFVVETVFQLPGLGKYFVSAVMNRDYPLVMGTTLVYCAILVICNLVVDLLTAWVDPRIRLDGGATQ